MSGNTTKNPTAHLSYMQLVYFNLYTGLDNVKLIVTMEPVSPGYKWLKLKSIN